MKKFEQIFLEAEDGCTLRFGKYLFGEFYRFYRKEVEKDTPTEKMIFDYVIKFVRGEYINKEKDSILISAFKTLADCKKKYKKVLQPDEKLLYRGMALTPKELKKMKWAKSSKSKMYESTYTYKGKSKIQSWTPKFHTAQNFADDAQDKGLIPAVLEYKFTDKSLLFNTEFLNELSQESGFGQENEIIRIENKPIKCKIYVYEFDIEEFVPKENLI